MPKLSRKEVRERLQELARTPVPEVLVQGAMCYSPAMPPDHWVFVCPTCGKRTAYLAGREGSRDLRPNAPADAERHVGFEACWQLASTRAALDAARRLPKRQGLRVDSSALCAACSPAATAFNLVLEVQLPDEDAPRRELVSEEDLLLLRAFLTGQDHFDAGQDGVLSLRRGIERIAQLLLGESPAVVEDNDK